MSYSDDDAPIYLYTRDPAPQQAVVVSVPTDPQAGQNRQGEGEAATRIQRAFRTYRERKTRPERAYARLQEAADMLGSFTPEELRVFANTNRSVVTQLMPLLRFTKPQSAETKARTAATKLANQEAKKAREEAAEAEQRRLLSQNNALKGENGALRGERDDLTRKTQGLLQDNRQNATGFRHFKEVAENRGDIIDHGLERDVLRLVTKNGYEATRCLLAAWLVKEPGRYNDVVADLLHTKPKGKQARLPSFKWNSEGDIKTVRSAAKNLKTLLKELPAMDWEKYRKIIAKAMPEEIRAVAEQMDDQNDEEALKVAKKIFTAAIDKAREKRLLEVQPGNDNGLVLEQETSDRAKRARAREGTTPDAVEEWRRKRGKFLMEYNPYDVPAVTNYSWMHYLNFAPRQPLQRSDGTFVERQNLSLRIAKEAVLCKPCHKYHHDRPVVSDLSNA